MGKLDFEGLNRYLLQRGAVLLSSWLPGGALHGHEFKAGDIMGSQGESLSINIKTGKWADFATGQRGGDLISLYATIKGISPGESFRALSADHGFSGEAPRPLALAKGPSLDLPPPGIPRPTMNHPKFGGPVESYEYLGPQGELLHYIAKYLDVEGSKQFVPFSWSKNSNSWVMKAWPAPRPLYGLELLAQRPNAPVMIVEGEKAAHAARAIDGNPYVVVSWSGGASAWKQADWKPITDRDVILWPDADEPGVVAMSRISGLLVINNKSVKILSVDDMPAKWDAADASFKSMPDLLEWAKPRVSLIERPAQRPEVLDPEDHRKVSVTVEEAPLDGYGSFSTLYRELGIQTQGEHHTPVSNLSNCVVFLSSMSEFKGKFWYDKFHNKYFTSWQVSEPTVWDDVMTAKLQAHLQRGYGLRSVTGRAAEGAMLIAASGNVRSEASEWLDSLPKWDGERRLETSFFVHLGCEPSLYQEAVSKNFWLSLAARILKPGCKVDTMVVLEGAQGAYKSTALNLIGGKFYTQNHESVSNKDFKLVMQGHFLIELAEMESLSRAEVTKTKAILSDAIDNFRVPYGRTPQRFPRQSVFVGTTNSDSYLTDETGARRFWPIRVGKINLKQLEHDRDQLFAEAMARVLAGETWWEMPLEETKEQQLGRYVGDPWEDKVASYLDELTLGGRRTVVTVAEIAIDALHIDLGNVTHVESRRIGKILKMLGFLNQSVRENERVVKKWIRN